MNARARIPDPIELDPRDCELCGRTVDQHRMVDHGDGPEFFCFPDDDIVTQWELNDSRDAWRHTGEAPPPKHVRNSDIGAKPAPASRPYSTPQSNVDAFRHLCREGDTEKLAEWMKRHPADTPFLLKTLNRGK
jgi:hypothetical protein